jgi:glycosyltransferase involved in cell wall biosynthesis
VKFRVVYVIDSLRAGGAEVPLLTTIRHIDRTRFEPVVIALSSQSDLRPALEQAGAVVYNINLGRLIAPVGLLRLVRLLRRLRPHVVHTHLRLANVYGRFAAALAFTPVITTSFHHLDYSYWPPSTWASRIWYWIDKWSARLFNRGFIAVSAAVRADYAGHFGLSDITLLYNYIELEEFTSGQHAGKSAEIRKQFGWTEDEFVLIVVARLSWEKGQRVVLFWRQRMLLSSPRLAKDSASLSWRRWLQASR